MQRCRELVTVIPRFGEKKPRFISMRQLVTKFLVSKGHDASHVLDLRPDDAADIEIWDFAARNSFVLSTKDEDFSRRASSPHANTQAVWVRLGNCRKAALLSVFDALLP